MHPRYLLHSLLLIGLSGSVVRAELELSLPRSAEAIPDHAAAARHSSDVAWPSSNRFASLDPARDVLHTLNALPIEEAARDEAADHAAGFRRSSLVPALLVLGIMVVLRVKLKHHWDQQRVSAA